jgi:hypothetical protein
MMTNVGVMPSRFVSAGEKYNVVVFLHILGCVMCISIESYRRWCRACRITFCQICGKEKWG